MNHPMIFLKNKSKNKDIISSQCHLLHSQNLESFGEDQDTTGNYLKKSANASCLVSSSVESLGLAIYLEWLVEAHMGSYVTYVYQLHRHS